MREREYLCILLKLQIQVKNVRHVTKSRLSFYVYVIDTSACNTSCAVFSLCCRRFSMSIGNIFSLLAGCTRYSQQNFEPMFVRRGYRLKFLKINFVINFYSLVWQFCRYCVDGTRVHSNDVWTCSGWITDIHRENL